MFYIVIYRVLSFDCRYFQEKGILGDKAPEQYGKYLITICVDTVVLYGELLAAVGKLTAEYGRIGGNLNQIARTLNEWHSPYPQLAGEVRAAVSDLAALKFEVLQKVGDAVGNIQTYQL